jgi:hypothetical protein
MRAPMRHVTRPSWASGAVGFGVSTLALEPAAPGSPAPEVVVRPPPGPARGVVPVPAWVVVVLATVLVVGTLAYLLVGRRRGPKK